MKRSKFLLSLILFASLLLSACGASNSTPNAMMDETATTDAMMKESSTSAAMMHDTPTPDAMMHDTPMADSMMDGSTPEAMMESPAWFSAAFMDAKSGTTFTINDFKGQVVLVEMMAVWCSTCKQQQDQMKALHEQMGMPNDLVTVSLDIDSNEDLETVKSYLDTTGFDWKYAVASPDVAREIASLYGSQFLNPPSAPVLIVDRHGVAHALPFGIKSADDLMQAVNMYLKEGM